MSLAYFHQNKLEEQEDDDEGEDDDEDEEEDNEKYLWKETFSCLQPKYQVIPSCWQFYNKTFLYSYVIYS